MTEQVFEYLYHLTDAAGLPALASEGLDPLRSREPAWRERMIYLAGSRGHAGAYEDHHGGWEAPAMLRVQVSDLDVDFLVADNVDMPDLMEQDDDDRDLSEVSWTESLLSSGQCGYVAVIPPSAIEVRLSPEVDEWMPLEEFVQARNPSP